jgi:hypothetical protein
MPVSLLQVTWLNHVIPAALPCGALVLWVADATKVPELVGAHVEDDVPKRALLEANAKFVQLLLHEILVVKVSACGAT